MHHRAPKCRYPYPGESHPLNVAMQDRVNPIGDGVVPGRPDVFCNISRSDRKTLPRFQVPLGNLKRRAPAALHCTALHLKYQSTGRQPIPSLAAGTFRALHRTEIPRCRIHVTTSHSPLHPSPKNAGSRPMQSALRWLRSSRFAQK